MYIKLLAVFAFVAVASAADLTLGVEGGRIIFEQNVTASPAIWTQIQNLTVNVTNDNEVISRIVVIDNRPEKNGDAKIVEGGEGQKNVTIQLKSPAVFRGYDFTIQVFVAQENTDPNSHLLNIPTSTGLDNQNPQVPYSKDVNVNDNSRHELKTENSDDVIIGAPKPTFASTTEAGNEDKEKFINPAVVEKDPTRQNRDTQGQKTNEQSPLPTTLDNTSGSAEPARNIKTDENTKKTLQEQPAEDFEKAIASIFAENNTTQKNEDSKVTAQVQPVVPQHGGEDQTDLALSDEQGKVRGAEKDSTVPALNKELKDENHTTPKSSSTTTMKNSEGHENIVPKVIPVSSESSSTTLASELTTEASKLGRHHSEHNHAVPLPYLNQ